VSILITTKKSKANGTLINISQKAKNPFTRAVKLNFQRRNLRATTSMYGINEIIEIKMSSLNSAIFVLLY
jgi:hypothetical protein